MTIDELIAQFEEKAPPAPADKLARFEADIGHALPEDYRYFLANCDGGYAASGLWYRGRNPEGLEVDAGVHCIGGLRSESGFSLPDMRRVYSERIPDALIWIHDDPFGNAICLGVVGEHCGRVYFWDHELEPGEDWDGSVESAGNLTLLANSFTEYVAGLG